MSDPSPTKAWFVIWTESRSEKRVEQRMAALGLSAWLPLLRERRRWSDRWREVETPLFPGYLFVRATLGDWSRILRTPGVLTVVREGGKPAHLADSLVESLRSGIEHGVAAEPVTNTTAYVPGQQVIVQDGALRGARGVVRQCKGTRQLVLWVAEIGRGVAFTIGSSLVAPAP
jgi:transcription antitermination factor NusG